jgi:hypothetical protein
MTTSGPYTQRLTQLLLALLALGVWIFVLRPYVPSALDDAAGVLFLDTKGDETGGFATTKLRDNEVLNTDGKVTYHAGR